MIKVNLRGHKQPKSAAKFVSPKNYTPVLLLAVALGFAGYGYWWYSSVTNQVADLDNQIKQPKPQRAPLETAINKNKIKKAGKKPSKTGGKSMKARKQTKLSPTRLLNK